MPGVTHRAEHKVRLGPGGIQGLDKGVPGAIGVHCGDERIKVLLRTHLTCTEQPGRSNKQHGDVKELWEGPGESPWMPEEVTVVSPQVADGDLSRVWTHGVAN